MSENRDLFGKMDALFEKRSPDLLLDKGLEHEDFPVLTDVVAAEAEKQALEQVAERRARDRREQERRQGDRRQVGLDVPATPRPKAPDQDFEHLVAAVEQRLSDLFIRQQLRMEEAVRRAIREELAKADKPL